MLTLQMLPAGNGDCLWLEYGPPEATRIVIIDGGVRDTAGVLQRRIDAAFRQRGSTSLDVELLVVTHIDNDHILGILELLAARPALRKKRYLVQRTASVDQVAASPAWRSQEDHRNEDTAIQPTGRSDGRIGRG